MPIVWIHVYTLQVYYHLHHQLQECKLPVTTASLQGPAQLLMELNLTFSYTGRHLKYGITITRSH